MNQIMSAPLEASENNTISDTNLSLKNHHEERDLMVLFENYQKKEQEADEKVLSVCRMRRNLPKVVGQLLLDAKYKKKDVIMGAPIDYEPPERIDVKSKIRDIQRVIARNVDLDKALENLEEDTDMISKEKEDKKRYFEFLVNALQNDDFMPYA
ncbi:unnamed protein product [Auanema sp. JU1783]|nr:unnamed protein product [Auanema sp. JU1783]